MDADGSNVRAQVAPQPQAGEPVEKPYAYEFGCSNGDDTFSVFIERSLPAKPHPDWPVKPLYASQQPANPAQVTDARKHINYLEGLLIQGGLFQGEKDAIRAAIAAIGAGGQAAADEEEFHARLIMRGDGKFYDEDGGEWELTQETYEKRTTDCPCAHCVARRSALSQPHPADERVVETLRGLLEYVDQTICTHDSTHRGGAIWTICDDCGKQWADDEGGFEPYIDAEPVAAARKVLSATEGR